MRSLQAFLQLLPSLKFEKQSVLRGGGMGAEAFWWSGRTWFRAQRQAAARVDAGEVDALLEQLGRPETLLADNGYFSEACDGVHGGEHRAADCDRAAAASSLLARTVCRAAS